MAPSFRRALMTVALTLTAALTLASCVEEPSRVPAPRPADAALGTPPSKVPLPTIVEMSTRTAGISPTLVSWQYISGAEAFNKQLDTRILALLDARAGGRHEPAALPTPPVTAPVGDGMSVRQEIILATGSIVGSRIVETTTGNGIQTVRTEEISYQDLNTGIVTGGAALIDPAQIGALRQMLREAPTTAPTAHGSPWSTTGPATTSPRPTSTGPGPVPPSAVAGPVTDAELLSALTFTPSGELNVTVNREPETARMLPEPVTITLTAEATDRVLTPAGQLLRSLVASGAPFSAPAPAPGGLEHINCDIVPCAALTYDDGPNTQTARLLEILARHKVFATFFEQGGYVTANPAIAKTVAAAGHAIANHTMTHPYLTRLSPAGIAREVNGAQAAIQKATGTSPAYLRPPYGATNTTVSAASGLPLVTWNVDSLDWQSKNRAVYVPRIMNLVKPGSIILQHDIHATTVDGQDELITELKDQGYYLVTVPQLFTGISLAAGGTYKCRGTAPGCTPGR